MTKISIVYDRDYTSHPFILLLIDSLSLNGLQVKVYSSADICIINHKYTAISSFSFIKRKINWDNSNIYKKVLRKKISELSFSKKYNKIALNKILNFYYSGYEKFRIFRRDKIDTLIPYLKSLKLIFFEESEIYIACRPHVLLLLLIRKIFKKTKIIYYPFEIYGEQSSKYSNFLIQVERFTLKFFLYQFITQNSLRLNYYESKRGLKGNGLIVHNYKNKVIQENKGSLREKLRISPTKKIVIYEGYLIHGRKLDSLILATKFFNDGIVLVMIGNSKGGWLENNTDIINNHINNNFYLLPGVDISLLSSYIADCDLGVIIYDDNSLNNYYCAPGKLSDYINCCIPVLAPDYPTLRPTLQEYGIGITFDNLSPESIASSINGFFQDKNNSKFSMQEIFIKATNSLNWDNEVKKLIDFLKSAR